MHRPAGAMAKRIAPCSWWRKSGYKQVIQLEADDGRWEGEGIKNARRAFTPTARGLRRSNRPPEHYPGKAFDSLDHRPPSEDGACSG